MYSTHRLRAATIRRSFFTVLIVFVLCGRGASPARASEIVDPDQQGVSATSYYPTFGQIPSKMTDNSGLSRSLPTGSAVPSNDADYPTHGTALIDMYRSGKDTHPDLFFSLNGTYSLAGMHYWNFNGDNTASHPSGGDRETTGDGIQSLDVAVSNTGVLGPWTTIGTFQLARAPGTDTYSGVTLPFGQSVDAQFVRFHVNSNFNGLGPDVSDYFGMSEVRFIGTAVVPEPTAIAIGAVLSGYLLARRCRGDA